MAGRGQKNQLKQMMSNLHEMLKLLGQDDGSKMVIKMDQFEYLRLQFTKAAQEYQKASSTLPNTPDKRQRGILLYKISSNRSVMDQNLKQMVSICGKANQKKNQKKRKTKKQQQQENIKLQNQLQYKNLTLYQLSKIYFKLTNRQSKQVSTKNQYYPDQQTLQQLKLRKPLKRGFSQTSDHQSQQYLQQQQLLNMIKDIDNRIQQKMGYILQGLKILNHNAVTISQSIGVVHNKILVNVEKLQENLQTMDDADKLLKKANRVASKPSCILNIIIIVLLAILGYLIVRKLSQQNK